MSIVGTATQLLERAGFEARFAATLLQARGPERRRSPRRTGCSARCATSRRTGRRARRSRWPRPATANRPAIIDELGELTFAELDARSTALANALRDEGRSSAKDGLGILARNHRGLFESIFAGAKLGARTLLLNTDFAGPQLADVCEREDVTALIHDEEFTEVAEAVEPSGGKYVAWLDGETDRRRPSRA